MKLVLLGSGNVAFHLAKAFTENGVVVSQIFGRNEEALKEISKQNSIPYSTENLADAEVYLITVSDGAVEEVSQSIEKKDCLVMHTSGSLPLETLKGPYRKGVFYPLQTFSKLKPLDYKKIPIFLEAEQNLDFQLMRNLATQLSNYVETSTYEKRKFIHLSAVFACNFVNHLFARSKELADAQNIPFTYFIPLIEETVQKISYIDPKEAQTGPSVRNDVRITQMQEAMLDGELLKIYKTMNESIKEMYEL